MLVPNSGAFTPHNFCGQLLEALAAAREIQDKVNKSNTLATLSQQLSANAQKRALADALKTAQEIQDEWQMGNTLAEFVAPYLRPEFFRPIFPIVQKLRYPYLQTRILTKMAPNLPPDMFREVLTAVQEIRSWYWKTIATGGMVPLMTATEQEEIVPQLFTTATLSIRSAGERKSLLSTIISVWSKFEFKRFERAMWNEGLRGLARYPRTELLSDLTALLPLIQHLGGQAALDEMFYTLRDVTQWWP